MNMFAYVYGNPVNLVDPWGLQGNWIYGYGIFGWPRHPGSSVMWDRLPDEVKIKEERKWRDEILEELALGMMGTKCPIKNVVSIFKNRKIYETVIQTSKGPIDVMAETIVKGKTLHLKDLAIFGRNNQPLTGLTREMLKARTAIINEARAAGFEKLRITGIRHSTSTSANPGKVIDMTIDLLK